MNIKKLISLASILLVSGCATLAVINFADLYGNSDPRERTVEQLPSDHIDYWSQVKPVVDNRCVVCHSCYDAPCQLKMSSIEGIVRGSSQERIYDLSRLTTAPTSRLFEDGQSVFDWRRQGFYPALNERHNTAEANREASLIYKMLQLKDHNPMPSDKILSSEFDLSLDRTQSCPKDNEFQRYAIDYPLGGMPYALPGLKSDEADKIMTWVEQGANYTARPPLAKKYLTAIEQWETWLNGDSLKRQLSSRYIYEHLFVAHLYFNDPSFSQGEKQYFKLVRSATPPGEPIKRINSRRPFDDPEVDRVYYRLLAHKATIIAKTHMPYALDQKRMARWQQLFETADFEVNTLPTYSKKIASNPFLAFADLPVNSRYLFMLDEAQHTIMGFIKGPVCRGQVALNVINDHFWVYFIEPDLTLEALTSEFLEENGENLELPAILESTIFRPITHWKHYAKLQKKQLAERDKFIAKHKHKISDINLEMIWDGNGHNPNAALTIMRHFDSATVEKGLIGTPPKTAWVIGYTLLERIHYLLVAGYDVYGNAGHQFVTRTYMDFLRMEGESNFLLMLPIAERKKVREFWYRNAEDQVAEYMTLPTLENGHEPAIDYNSDNKQLELYQKIAERLQPALASTQAARSDEFSQLQALNIMPASAVAQLPQTAIIQVEKQQGNQSGQQTQYSYYTLLRNDAHLSMTSMFGESANRIPAEDRAMILEGIIGSYPNVFYRLKHEQLDEFIAELSQLSGNDSYSQFLDQYGVRRSDPNFWQFSDQLASDYRRSQPIRSGLLDYNRLENR